MSLIQLVSLHASPAKPMHVIHLVLSHILNLIVKSRLELNRSLRPTRLYILEHQFTRTIPISNCFS